MISFSSVMSFGVEKNPLFYEERMLKLFEQIIIGDCTTMQIANALPFLWLLVWKIWSLFSVQILMHAIITYC